MPPYVGEIRIFAGNFPPAGWMFCDGQALPISENETLFQVIGTTYGGDGQETFNLPNLQSRVPIHQGTAATGTLYQLGDPAGVEQVTLTTSQIPNHTHPFTVSGDQGTQTDPTNAMIGANPTIQLFRPGAASQAHDPSSVSVSGGSQPHENMQPYICMYYIISLFGIYPQPA